MQVRGASRLVGFEENTIATAEAEEEGDVTATYPVARRDRSPCREADV